MWRRAVNARFVFLMTIPVVITTCIPTAASAQTRPSPPVAAEADRGSYRIGPEDVLAIAILEAPDLNRTVHVSPAGEISLALVGAVKVAGLTASQIEAAIADRLREKYIRNPNVSVQVTEARSSTVSVTGAVRKPGVFQMRGPRHLLEVLSLAEGVAEDAGESVFIAKAESGTHNGDATAPASEAVREVKLKALFDTADAATNILVYPGDVVKVTRQGMVYVVGEVRKPGAFAMAGGTHSVLRALAQSEGLGPIAAPGKALILRANSKGDRDLVELDLDRVLRGKAPDVAMLPEDVLFVPQSGSKAFGRAAADAALRILTFRIPFIK